MALRLNTTNTQCPGCFRYLVGETGQWIPPLSRDPYTAYADLVPAVLSHHKANGIQIPPNLDALIQEQICHRINDPDWCNPGSPYTSEQVEAIRRSGSSAFTFNDVLSFTRTMATWWFSGHERVSDEEISRRAGICSTCPLNIDPAGCTGCNSNILRDAAAWIVGGRTHPMDSQLRSCAACGCSLKSKVRIPKDVLLKHMPKDKMDRLVAKCWLRPENN